MSRLHNNYEFKLMRQSGKISALALKCAMEAISVGVSGIDIDKVAEKSIYKAGGDLSYKTIPGYNHATCVTVNEEVVHGVPTDRKIMEGDLVSVDLAVSFKGWHTDTAWTVLVGAEDEEKSRFLKTGEEALWAGVKQAMEGNSIGDIGAAIQSKVEGSGYSVVRSLVGHGVGRKLHEDPEVPGYGKAGAGMVLKSGMALAIEVIYTKGSPDIVLGADGWTFYSADGSLAGLFEMTVLVGRRKAEVLTDWREA